jgi:hypothetical protein
MKVKAIDGRSGFCKEAEATITSETATFAGGFGFIKAKGAASYFDTIVDATLTKGKALVVGTPMRIDAFATSEDNPLAAGDEFLPVSLEISCWSNDCPVSPQEGEIDFSSQCDRIAGRKDLRGDGIVSESGTISGMFMTDSEMQRELEGLFRTRVVEKAGKVTLIPRQTDQTYLHFFIYREMTAAGEVEITLFRKLRIPQLSEGQPASGQTPFNFNYTTLESWQYEKTVA